jgi:L-cysteate sulfo-lyase
VTATTTGGTQAGLVAGFAGTGVEVLGISAAADAATTTALVGWLVGELGAPVDAVQVDDRFVGPGYGVPTEDGRQAMAQAAELHGLVLDPVYSAKAFAGLAQLAREGRFGAGAHVVFVATGGLPSLFAFPRATVVVGRCER